MRSLFALLLRSASSFWLFVKLMCSQCAFLLSSCKFILPFSLIDEESICCSAVVVQVHSASLLNWCAVNELFCWVGASLFCSCSCNAEKSECTYTDKKENQIFLIYKEIQSGAVAKWYMRKGFLIYEEMRKYFPIYEEAVNHIWLCNCFILNIYQKTQVFPPLLL